MKSVKLALLAGAACLAMADAQSARAACSPAATAGNDTINCTGVSGGINTQGGDDTLSNSGFLGTFLSPTTRMGAGNDTFNNTAGSALDVRQEGDNDTANVSGGIVTSLTQGAGNDIFNSTGGLTTSVDQGGDNDTATVSAGSVTTLTQGAGNDIFNSNGGSAGTVFQNDGNDDANITAGLIGLVLDQGADNDDVIMSGGFLTSLIQDTGADTLQLSGGTAALVAQGSGDDDATWSGGNMLIYGGGDGSDDLIVTGAAGYNGTQLLAGGDDLSSADGFTDTLTLQGLASSPAIDGTRLVNWERVGISGSFVSFSNNALTVGSDAGDGLFIYGLGYVTANNGFSLTGNLSVESGSGFGHLGPVVGTNTYSVSGDVVMDGRLNLASNGTTGDVFNVGGDYSGSGDLNFDVNLDSNTADQLVVQGDVTGGTTFLQATYTGAGSYTGDGPGAGIAVVSVTGNTAPGDFQLYENFLGFPLVVGAFEYTLSLESDNTWYLQSTVRGGAVAAIAAGGMVSNLGTAFLGTYHERTGEQQRNPNSNIWGRVIGQFGSESVSASGIGDIESSGSTTGLQAGLDLVAHENASGGRTRLGLYGGLGWLNHDVTTTDSGGASGNNEGEGKVAGLYASHSQNGFYADAVVQKQWLDISVSGSGLTASTDATGWLASLEMGQDIALTDHSSLEPQAQFIIGSNSTDLVIATDSDRWSWSDDDVMLGRIGARLKSAHTFGDGTAVTGWLKANVWTDFKNDDQSASVDRVGSSTVAAVETKKTWVDLGLGFDVQASSHTAFFVDGDVSFGVAGDYQAFDGKAGFKVLF